MQLFTKMANRWAERDCESEECRLFRERLAGTQVTATMAHDSYLINLASPDPVLRARSIASFVSELRRCSALDLDYLVSHPGNFMDERDAGIARNADAISEALAQVEGRTILCLETTAGSGTALGATFEELEAIIERIDARHRDRVGVCVDTCHVYAAGYDLRGDYDGVVARFGDVVGLERLRLFHLNDSATPFASRRDRHAGIGEGSLGDEPFRRLMTDERFGGVPKVLETPKEHPGDAKDVVTLDRQNLAKLRGFVA